MSSQPYVNSGPSHPRRRFLKAFVLAFVAGLLVWLAQSRYAGSGSGGSDSLVGSIRYAIAADDFQGASSRLDDLVQGAVNRLKEGRVDEAIPDLQVARDLVVLARQRLAVQASAAASDDAAPAVSGASEPAEERSEPAVADFGLTDTESAVRYHLAVALYRAMEERHAHETAAAEASGRTYVPPEEETLPIREELLKGLEADPQNKRLWRLLGILDNLTGRFGSAAMALQKAVEIDPYFAEAYNNLGRAMMNLHQYDKALESFEKALLVGKDKPEVVAAAHFNLGVFYSVSGASADEPGSLAAPAAEANRRKAVEHLRQYLQAPSTDPAGVEQARRRLANLSAASVP